MQEAARSSRAGTTGGKQERVHHAVRTPRGEQVAQGTVIPPRQPSLFRRPPGGVTAPPEARSRRLLVVAVAVTGVAVVATVAALLGHGGPVRLR